MPLIVGIHPAINVHLSGSRAIGDYPHLYCLFRHALEYIATITPIQEILQRPGVADRALAAVSASPPLEMPGPDRAQLLDLVR